MALKTGDRAGGLPAPARRTSSSIASTRSYRWSTSTWGEMKDRSCISTQGSALLSYLPGKLGLTHQEACNPWIAPRFESCKGEAGGIHVHTEVELWSHHTWLLFPDWFESTSGEGTLGLLYLWARRFSDKEVPERLCLSQKGRQAGREGGRKEREGGRKGEEGRERRGEEGRKVWGQRESTKSHMVRSGHHSHR